MHQSRYFLLAITSANNCPLSAVIFNSLCSDHAKQTAVTHGRAPCHLHLATRMQIQIAPTNVDISGSITKNTLEEMQMPNRQLLCSACVYYGEMRNPQSFFPGTMHVLREQPRPEWIRFMWETKGRVERGKSLPCARRPARRKSEITADILWAKWNLPFSSTAVHIVACCI